MLTTEVNWYPLCGVKILIMFKKAEGLFAEENGDTALDAEVLQNDNITCLSSTTGLYLLDFRSLEY